MTTTSQSKVPLRVLHLEDNPHDRELVQAILQADGIHCRQVQTKQEFQTALAEGGWDVIISDYALPSYDGFAALEDARKKAPQVPFILFSGTIGEEAAVESLKRGATDYVLKNRPERLTATVKQALREVRERVERRRAEELLRQSEARFQSFMDNTPAIAFMKDADGKYLFVNRTFERLFRKHCLELRGKTDLNLFSDKIATHLRENDLRVLSAAEPVESIESMPTPDGIVRQWLLHRFPFQREGGESCVGAVGLDITERLRSEDRIREQATLLERANDAICVMGLDQCVQYWNKAAEKLYGWTAEEALGRKVTRLLFRPSTPLPPKTLEALLRNREWQGELRQVTKAGADVLVESRWTLVVDTEGKRKSILLINTDITQRRNLELQFHRAQRLESIGMLASGIAHDLNNVLAPMMMAIPMLRDKESDPSKQRLLDMLERSAQRGKGLVQQVLSFAHGSETERQTLQAKPIILDIEKIIEETFPKSIQFRKQLQPDLWPIEANATQIHQILLNLCVNARDAMPRGGMLTVAATNLLLDQSVGDSQFSIRPGPYLLLMVEDTGTGMPPEVLEKVFEPFFTTKPAGQGTGLGLATVSGIVKSLGGFIEVKSQPDKGTCFRVYLPALDTAQPKVIETTPRELPSGHGEVLLLVDDEAAIREIMKGTLENFGYAIRTAEHGLDALSVFSRHQQEITLVITDMEMPLMNGAALVSALHKINPQLKVIVTSGLNDTQFITSNDRIRFLQKPYTAEQLLTAVHDLLAGKESDERITEAA